MSYLRNIQKLLTEENHEEYDEKHHHNLVSELAHSSMQYCKLYRMHQNFPESYKKFLTPAKEAALDTVAKDHMNLVNYDKKHGEDVGYHYHPKLLDHIEHALNIHDEADAAYDDHFYEHY